MKQTGAVINKRCMLSISSYKCLHRSLCSLEKRSFRVIDRLSASTLVLQITFRRSRHFRNWILLTPVSTCHRKTLCYQIPRPPMIIQKTENQFQQHSFPFLFLISFARYPFKLTLNWFRILFGNLVHQYTQVSRFYIHEISATRK